MIFYKINIRRMDGLPALAVYDPEAEGSAKYVSKMEIPEEDAQKLDPVAMNVVSDPNSKIVTMMCTNEELVHTAATTVTVCSSLLNGFAFADAPLADINTGTEVAQTPVPQPKGKGCGNPDCGCKK